MKKNAISKKLGIATEGPLTKKVCLQKVKTLRTGLSRNRYKGKLRDYAIYYASWYKWRASNKRAA